MPLTDAQLIARALGEDDRHAFGELVRRHQSAVRLLLRRLTCGNAALADDLAQETFLRVYRGLSGYRGGARFSTWIYRIAYHVFISEARRSRALAGDDALADLPDPGDGAGAALARIDLDRAMGGLSAAERTAISLAYGGGSTHEEVAEILECPLGTVKSHLLRGMVKLRERLGAPAVRGEA
jgi:RNA polymerase sigma-70 factor (ECF subfamily)